MAMTYIYNENEAVGHELGETYDCLGAEIVLFAVLVKVVKDLGARHYRPEVKPKKEIRCS